MRRGLFIVLAGLLLGAPGCDRGDSRERQRAAPGRVDAVTTNQAARAKRAEPDKAGFCDVSADGAAATRFVLPPLAGASASSQPAGAPAGGTGRWRWVNVWATWCKPCIEELPLVAAWRSKLAAEGIDVDVQFVSVDESDDDVNRFRAEHPDMPAGVRVADLAALPAWFTALGLDAGASIPIHLFVDGQDRLRCARVGAISAGHYDSLRAVMNAR